MKKLRSIFTEVKTLAAANQPIPLQLLWQLICYAPKMPLRLHQQQLLATATTFSLPIFDDHFAKGNLNFNGFKWGSGPVRVLLMHGWASKAADFTELITGLIKIEGLTIIAIDAPGHGSSDGDLSNLLLFVQALKATIQHFGAPDVVIGHSLGTMANVMMLAETGIRPKLLISLAPLINLQENFRASMAAASIPAAGMETFFDDFNKVFGTPADHFNWHNLYRFDNPPSHWLAFDADDQISPYIYLAGILAQHPEIKHQVFSGIGHERIIKDAEVIDAVVGLVKGV